MSAPWGAFRPREVRSAGCGALQLSSPFPARRRISADSDRRSQHQVFRTMGKKVRTLCAIEEGTHFEALQQRGPFLDDAGRAGSARKLRQVRGQCCHLCQSSAPDALTGRPSGECRLSIDLEPV